MNINYKKLENIPSGLLILRRVLDDFNEMFSPILSDLKADFDEFSLQLINKGFVIIATNGENIIGFVAIYANNHENKTAFISLIAVKTECFGNGIGAQLLSRAENYASQNGMISIELEVKQSNTRAIRFYNNHGYVIFRHDSNSFFLKKSLVKIDYISEVVHA